MKIYKTLQKATLFSTLISIALILLFSILHIYVASSEWFELARSFIFAVFGSSFILFINSSIGFRITKEEAVYKFIVQSSNIRNIYSELGSMKYQFDISGKTLGGLSFRKLCEKYPDLNNISKEDLERSKKDFLSEERRNLLAQMQRLIEICDTSTVELKISHDGLVTIKDTLLFEKGDILYRAILNIKEILQKHCSVFKISISEVDYNVISETTLKVSEDLKIGTAENLLKQLKVYYDDLVVEYNNKIVKIKK